MNPMLLVAASPWLNAAVAGGLLMSGVVLGLLALAGAAMAFYAAVPRLRHRLDGRLYGNQADLVDLHGYQRAAGIPSAPSDLAAVRRPLRQLVMHMTGLSGLGVWLFTEPTVIRVPLVALVLIVVLLALGVGLLLAEWLVEAREQSQPPRQRSFDDYRDELRRESDRYLDQVNQIWRERP
jgi:hypothetical protein